MPKYKVLELSLIGNELHQAGAIVEYDGLPSENLEPTDAAGEAKRQEYIESNKRRIRQMMEDNKGGDVLDTAALIKRMHDQGAEADERARKAQEDQPALIAQAVVAAMAAFFPNGVPAAAPVAEPAPAAPDLAKEPPALQESTESTAKRGK